MTLDQYLSDNSITETAFAATIGVDQSSVNRMRKGQVPSKPIMARIFAVTEGAVRADDFFGLPTEAERAA